MGQCVSFLSLTYLWFPVWALDLTKQFHVLVVCSLMTSGLLEELTFNRLMTYIYIYMCVCVCVCVCVCRTAPLTSRCCVLYIYSTNIRTEYFKHAAHSPCFPLQNAVYFIMLPFFWFCIIHILNTGCAKNLKENSGA